MGSRVEFSKAVRDLLIYATQTCGYDIVMDWLLRDAETQNRLYKSGKSKLDGYTKRSRHQAGLALDLYILETGKISSDHTKYEKLHNIWTSVGGRDMIDWDMGHFEF